MASNSINLEIEVERLQQYFLVKRTLTIFTLFSSSNSMTLSLVWNTKNIYLEKKSFLSIEIYGTMLFWAHFLSL